MEPVALENFEPFGRVSGDQIKTILAQYGLTQVHLAQILGVSHASVSQWREKGVSGIAARCIHVLFGSEDRVYRPMRNYILEQHILKLRRQQNRASAGYASSIPSIC